MYFSVTIAKFLKLLAEGKVLKFTEVPDLEYDRNRYFIKSKEVLESPNKLKSIYKFWMDSQTGELKCEYFTYVGESPDQDDEDEKKLYKGQEALAFLYPYGFRDISTYKKEKTEATSIRDDSTIATIAIGLKYLIYIMKTTNENYNLLDRADGNPIDSKDFLRFEKSTVQQFLLNYDFNSYDEFSKKFSGSLLNLEDIIEELKSVADNKDNEGKRLGIGKIYGVNPIKKDNTTIPVSPINKGNPPIPVSPINKGNPPIVDEDRV